MHLGHDAEIDSDDPIQRIFGVNAKDLLDDEKQKFQTPDPRNMSFWKDAGPEEIKHLHELIKQLSEDEIRQIAKLCSTSAMETDIETLKSWIEEVGREDFYEIYNQRVSNID